VKSYPVKNSAKLKSPKKRVQLIQHRVQSVSSIMISVALYTVQLSTCKKFSLAIVTLQRVDVVSSKFTDDREFSNILVILYRVKVTQ